MSHGWVWVPLEYIVQCSTCNVIIGIFIYPGLNIRSKNIIQNGITHKFKQLHVNKTRGDKKKEWNWIYTGDPMKKNVFLDRNCLKAGIFDIWFSLTNSTQYHMHVNIRSFAYFVLQCTSVA
jgi:hypothetical protein